MQRNGWFPAAVVMAVALLASAAETNKPLKANGSIELTDPAGDVEPIHTSGDKDYPGFDVVKLSIKSDGKQIAVAATLKDPPGEFASSAIEVDFDTDNNPKSGVTFIYPPVGGFEYVGKLCACADYADHSSACTGGSKTKATSHWAAVNLARFTGKNEYEKDTVVDSMGFPGKKASAKTPITGTLVQGAFDYADLHVKSGQTIRLLVKESHGTGADDGYFPPILLTLK
jgi:hypothetical protein